MSIISINTEFKKIRKLPVFRLPASQPAGQPAVRPGSARCMAPEIQHSKGCPFPFTKLLFRRGFIHCTMVILLYFLSLLSSLSIGMRKQFQLDHNIPYKVLTGTIMRACHFIVTNRFVYGMLHVSSMLSEGIRLSSILGYNA